MKKLLMTFLVALGVIFVSQSFQAKADEAALLSEGEDTKTEIKFRTYSGKYSSLFLNAGDKIAVISPSALPSREQVDSTIKGLASWGYEPIAGKHICEETRTISDIVEDLEWALNDPEIKAVFCVRGGYGASEIADILSKELISTADKLIIGYSDITVYHSVWTSSGVPSIHSCMSGTFNGLPEKCFTAEEKILKGELPVYKCENSSYCKKGTAEGILIGGNLSTFTSVIGTAYDCTKIGQPYILFLEDVGENIQHIHRYLTVLKHAGVLDNAAGLIFGEWTELPADMGDYDGSSRGGEFTSIADMISRQILSGLDIPVAFGFPAGHGDINYPLLMGVNTKLKVGTDSFTIEPSLEGLESSKGSAKKLKGTTDISHIDEQGNVVLSITRDKLEVAGYKFGDVVKVAINGKSIKMPVVSKSADVDPGKPALLARDYDSNIRLVINKGSFAAEYGIAVKTVYEDGGFEWNYAEGVAGPVKVSVKLKKAGSYLKKYERRQGKTIDYLVLVNKLNALPEDWEDYLETTFLVNSVGDYVEVELKAYDAYLALKEDLEKNDGIHLELDSARRSLAAQQDIMDRFIDIYGADYAFRTVAPVGYSEHHTGIALDLYFVLDGKTYYKNEDMIQRPDVWEKIHAKLAQYGFILRYLDDKEHITGYGYEPWHIRYVDDSEIAKEIMEKGITFEEYLGTVKSAEVTIDYGKSEEFSMDDLEAAVTQIKCKFATFAGCELHSISYSGDKYNTKENVKRFNEMAGKDEYSKILKFTMSFHSPEEGDGALDLDKEYTDYEWWLGLNAKGGWDVVSYGY